ncbi:histidine phosphatase family protein [Neobacillus drentensis]|uniref:histidine phosphatase family protein n=1 Tax=Neobacillus drentensis TaxID=220684 RepID=UPI0030013EAF
MQITLIRHLPTEWNKKTWLQGRRDIELSPLTDELYLGIAENAQRLKQLAPFELVLASTLKRTHQTAQLYGHVCQAEGLLDELDFGPFEGRPKEELFEKYRELWIHNPKDLVLGESIKNLEDRVVLFIEKYKKLSNILVFGHGSWIRAMISYSQFGDVNHMNKIIVENNACITLALNCNLRE